MQLCEDVLVKGVGVRGEDRSICEDCGSGEQWSGSVSYPSVSSGFHSGMLPKTRWSPWVVLTKRKRCGRYSLVLRIFLRLPASRPTSLRSWCLACSCAGQKIRKWATVSSCCRQHGHLEVSARLILCRWWLRPM